MGLIKVPFTLSVTARSTAVKVLMCCRVHLRKRMREVVNMFEIMVVNICHMLRVDMRHNCCWLAVCTAMIRRMNNWLCNIRMAMMMMMVHVAFPSPLFSYINNVWIKRCTCTNALTYFKSWQEKYLYSLKTQKRPKWPQEKTSRKDPYTCYTLLIQYLTLFYRIRGLSTIKVLNNFYFRPRAERCHFLRFPG